MQHSMHTAPGTKSFLPTHPYLISFDCGEECSLQHWLEVCRLVDEVEVVEVDTDTVYRAADGGLLEVKSSTTYQNFTRDIV